MASIIVITSKQEGDYYPLGRRTNVIGRDQAVPIQILDERVSRKHMQIRFDEETDAYYDADLNSKHGVFVNSEKVTGPVKLTEDTIITIGSTSLLFTLKDFTNRENALNHYKKAGERIRGTLLD
jgi:pSer/pThr/pTyr-binding forkhead associated (FHA) protein